MLRSEISDLSNEGGIVSGTYDRRTFLTHSAATVGGVAMAGTVVDTLIADAASATTGVGVGAPVVGGTLTIGVTSDVGTYHSFTGQTGKLDAAGFYVASAVYDSLFYVNSTATGYLPGLALNATPSNSNKTWTFNLRPGVKFHNGQLFNADAVVANFAAAHGDLTVGLAILNIIDSCVKTGPMQVQYHTHFSYATFPIALAEQQIGFMAAPAMFPSSGSTYPIGTGPFKFVSWTIGNNSQWTKNTAYWRKSSTGHALPYLSGLQFKVLVDPGSCLNALKTGGVNIAVFFDGASQKAITVTHVSSGGHPVLFTNSLHGLAEPSKNCVMINTTSKNWAGQVGTAKSSAPWWNTGPGSPCADNGIRLAMAHALNRASWLSSQDSGQGLVVDGIFRSTSPYYVNPAYPALSTATATTLVHAWRLAHGNAVPTVHMQYVSGSTTAHNQFLFVQNALHLIGITVVGIAMVQSQLINNAIFKYYELTAWTQFGTIVPATNYVWWDSKAGASGFVNFANQADPLVESNMLLAMNQPSIAGQKPYWGNVNKRFAIDVPYLWLDATGSVWAAQWNVQNWANAKMASTSSVNSTLAVLSPTNGGFPGWAEVWL